MRCLVVAVCGLGCLVMGLPVAGQNPPGGPKNLKNSIGMEFVPLPGGKFQMGSPGNEPDRIDTETSHTVTLTQAFRMAAHEVTQEQYEKVMGKNPSHFRGARLPVEQVNHADALQFCRSLSDLPAEKAAGRKYRLPSEAEWEYACRAGTATPFHFGAALNGTQANCNGEFPYGSDRKGPFLAKTSPVGSYPPNAWGLHDMHGNVWEWCADWYGPLQEAGSEDPPGGFQGVSRVLRGGSWSNHGKNCRAADRYGYDPVLRRNYLGFRVVLP